MNSIRAAEFAYFVAWNELFAPPEVGFIGLMAIKLSVFSARGQCASLQVRISTK